MSNDICHLNTPIHKTLVSLFAPTIYNHLGYKVNLLTKQARQVVVLFNDVRYEDLQLQPICLKYTSSYMVN